MPDVDDNLLLEGAINGDQEALATLFERHRPVIHKKLLPILGNEDDANDVLQDTFIKVMASIAKFERRSQFRSWACRIAIHGAHELQRSRKRKRETSTVTDAECAALNEDPIFELEKSDTLRLSDAEKLRQVEQVIREMPLPKGEAHKSRVKTFLSLVWTNFVLEGSSDERITKLKGRAYETMARSELLDEGITDPTQQQLRDRIGAIKEYISVAKNRPSFNKWRSDLLMNRRELLRGTIGAVGYIFLFGGSGEAFELVPPEHDKLRNFLVEYSECYATDRQAAEHFLREFLKFLAKTEQAHGLRIEQIAGWLQPLRSFRLLEDAIALLASSSWLPPEVDREEWRFFSLVCQRVQAHIYRRQKRIREAETQLECLEEEWKRERFTSQRRLKERSVVAYEFAYCKFARCKTGEAKRYFQESAVHARHAGDSIGEIIGAFMAIWADYFGRIMAPEDIKRQAGPLRKELERVGCGQERATLWLNNIDGYLPTIALDQGDAREAKALYTKVLQSEKYTRWGTDPRHEIDKATLLGRLTLVEGNYVAAVKHLGRFLPVNIPHADQEPGLVEHCMEVDEIAVAFRDAGIALTNLGLHDSAINVWTKGLECSDDASNSNFKADMRRLLKD